MKCKGGKIFNRAAQYPYGEANEDVKNTVPIGGSDD